MLTIFFINDNNFVLLVIELYESQTNAQTDIIYIADVLLIITHCLNYHNNTIKL